MSRRFLPRGFPSAIDPFTLSPGEVVYDETGDNLRIGNGALPGGQQLINTHATAINILDFDSQAVSGNVDASAAIREAIAELPATGGAVYIPRGVQASLASTIPITAPVSFLFEGGMDGGTPLVVTFPTGDVFTGFGINGITAERMNMTASVPRTSGAFWNLIECARVKFSGRMTKHYRGIELDGGIEFRIREMSFRNAVGASEVADGGHICLGRNNATVDGQIYHCTADSDTPGDMSTYGIKLMYCDAAIIHDNDIIHSGSDLLVKPANGQTASAMFVHHNYFDTAATGIDFNPDAGGLILRAYLDHNWHSSHTGRGMITQGAGTILGVEVHRPIAMFNTLDGMLFNNGTDIKVRDPRVGGNGGSGIAYGAGVMPDIVGGWCGDYDGAGPNEQFGIYIPDATTGYRIRGVDVTGNETPIGANGGGLIEACAGYPTFTDGTDSIASGASSVVVNHEMYVAPRAQDITLSATSPFGSNSLYVDPATITASQFTVKTGNGAAAAILNFKWEARVRTGT